MSFMSLAAAQNQLAIASWQRTQHFPGFPQFPRFPRHPQQPLPPWQSKQSWGDQQSNNLINGVKSGQINRNEFNHLHTYQLETERLRARYAEGGLSKAEQRVLAARERTYDRLYNKYSKGDHNPNVKPRNEYQQRQLDQSNHIFNGLSNGLITRGEGNYLINQQKGISRTIGHYQRGGVQPWERAHIHNRFNNAGMDIGQATYNWNTDWNPPFFGGFGGFPGFGMFF